ncbi:MAG: hypothetical protein RMJ53_02570 [Chitinophagales bacterium]|nr:hypothetical protein [Chitinophagales bacterium]MDW8273094.1 hypothetical protein [Chitinophagales bacterium]
MKNNNLYILLLFLLAVILHSCKKDESPEGNGNAEVEMENVWSAQSFALNTDYITAGNQTLKFTKLKYYVSNFVFIKDDGTEYKVPESYYLVNAADPASSKLKFKDLPAGDYKGLRFIVGVDSIRNTSGAQEGALATTNDMFWNWNTGYVFFKAEGTSPQAPSGFTYHIGGFKAPHSAIRTISFDFGSDRLKVRKGKEVVVHAKADIKKLFNNIDVSSPSMVHMPGPNAVKFADNYATLFSYDHVHN